MKANLPTSEPETLARWAAMNLYGKIRAARAGAPKFILHDGPPYANGNIHLGTALNKILKDFVVKSKSMAGFDAPFVVGYDCHGLPTELRGARELGARKREMPTAEFCLAGRTVAVLIWTTTPWTIPSNLAIAFHPEFDYAAYDVEGKSVIVAEALAEKVAAAVGRPFGPAVAKMKGADLERIRFQHPLYA